MLLLLLTPYHEVASYHALELAQVPPKEIPEEHNDDADDSDSRNETLQEYFLDGEDLSCDPELQSSS